MIVLSSLEISIQMAFCDVMSNYRKAHEQISNYNMWKPYLRVCDSELNKKSNAVTKFSPRVIKARIRRLREDREVFEPWTHVR
jgi:hypothetical protein